MYAKLRINLIGLAVALGFVVVGFSLGEAPGAPRSGQAGTLVLVQIDDSPAQDAQVTPPVRTRRGGLKRHLAMPYVSFAALLPPQES